MTNGPITDARSAIILDLDQRDAPQHNKKYGPRRTRPYTKQRNAKIIAALQGGRKTDEVAAEFGLSRSGLYAVLRSEGFGLMDLGNRTEKRQLIHERNAAIIEKYKSGLSAETIGQEYGLTRERVCQIVRPLLLPQLKVERARMAREALAAEEEKIRAEARAEREARLAQAVSMVRGGASRLEAMRELGLPTNLVNNACRKAGLPHKHGRWMREPELEQRAADIRRQRAEGKTWDEIGQSNYSWASRNLPDLVGTKSERKVRPESPVQPAPDPWTPEKVETLCRMYFDGCSAQQIADVLGEGFSRSSVIGKSNRLRAQKLLVPPTR